MQDLPNGGGGGRTPNPKIGLCGRGGANSGGGGRRSKHWPPGAGDPRYATDVGQDARHAWRLAPVTKAYCPRYGQDAFFRILIKSGFLKILSKTEVK